MTSQEKLEKLIVTLNHHSQELAIEQVELLAECFNEITWSEENYQLFKETALKAKENRFNDCLAFKEQNNQGKGNMIKQKIQLAFVRGEGDPWLFRSLRDYQSFIFDEHIHLTNPPIQIKMTNDHYIFLQGLVAPPLGETPKLLLIEGNPLCHPLFRQVPCDL